ncbi:uncharacterized protein BP01DRAFT_395080, partial [Aspergillus saccharolyticus JOP 1030-1]
SLFCCLIPSTFSPTSSLLPSLISLSLIFQFSYRKKIHKKTGKPTKKLKYNSPSDPLILVISWYILSLFFSHTTCGLCGAVCVCACCVGVLAAGEIFPLRHFHPISSPFLAVHCRLLSIHHFV